MQYKSFTILNYKAIKGPLKVDLSRSKLIPIIGVNECGKTTILQAILAFDRYNDDVMSGRHLLDVENLYEAKPEEPKIVADIELSLAEFVTCVRSASTQAKKDLGAKYYRDNFGKNNQSFRI